MRTIADLQAGVRRRDLLALGGGLLTLLDNSAAASSNVTLGAIRWDAWYEPQDTGERAAVENTLGAFPWHNRAPACATVSGRVDLTPCATDAQIEAEIAQAYEAKLNYWAFCWYGADSPMQAAWRFYQASNKRSLINWCIIIGTGNLLSGKPTSVPALAQLMKMAEYQTVLAGRPLFFLLHDQTPADQIRTKVDELRSACRQIGCGDPYVVMLIGAAPGVTQVTGTDAIGIYSKPNPAPPAAPYSTLTKSTEVYWTTLAKTGQSVVPTALTGADRRPRIERPVPWEMAQQKPFDGVENYYEAGTSQEIAAHIRAMVSWIAANRQVCPAQAGLIYSWNEHDEGGSTLNPSVGDGDKIIRAVARVL